MPLKCQFKFNIYQVEMILVFNKMVIFNKKAPF